MTRWIIIFPLLALLVMVLPVLTQGSSFVVCKSNVDCETGAALGLHTNFETTVEPCTNCTEDDGVVWVKDWLGAGDSAITFDAPTTGLNLFGTQALKISSGTNQVAVAEAPIAASTQGSIFFAFRTTQSSYASNTHLLRMNDVNQGITILLRSAPGNTLGLKLYHGTVDVSIDNYMVGNTTYYMWLDYNYGTGTNGVARLYVTSQTAGPIIAKPATPVLAITNGTATNGPSTFLWFSAGVANAGTGMVVNYYDRVLHRSGATPIGDVCFN